ncbi:GTP pyrophosphokinase [Psychroserpens sp. S379A]|uniref:GTP pyrophosphokinase n=1 Tax=Psychroserpens sp. S379A TaxID=3415137 RepID=UPI003C7E0FB6
MEKNKALEEYNKCKTSYNRLGKNIVEALNTFLTDNGIGYLDIYHRVKKFDSFYEKIDRKGYKNPFEDIEDICGIRVICFYASDVEKINTIISKEFKILEQENKSELLGLKEFAYRSQHFIIQINEEWNAAPNYRGLEKLKAEIQVRTILMHAWAEIEHKLNYKSDAQVPDKFQRKLFRLSAKFEEADEQFDELRNGIDGYRIELQKTISKSKVFNLEQDFNLETLLSFLKFNFPKSNWNEKKVSRIFESFNKGNLDFEKIEKAIKLSKPNYSKILEDLKKNNYESQSETDEKFLWIAMDIGNNDFYQLRQKRGLQASWKKVVDKWRKTMK